MPFYHCAYHRVIFKSIDLSLWLRLSAIIYEASDPDSMPTLAQCVIPTHFFD